MTSLGPEPGLGHEDATLRAVATGSGGARTPRSTRSVVAAVLADRPGVDRSLVVLVDHEAVVVDVFPGGSSARHGGMSPVVGESLSIDAIGHNAIGSAVERRAAVEVVGSEHDSESLSALRTCAVPIRSARTGLVVATLGYFTESVAVSGMELPWLVEIARHVENVLAETAVHRETSLMRAFIAANRNSRQVVIALGEGFAIGNDVASTWLTATDIARIRSMTADVAQWREARIRPMVLADGTAISMSANPVVDGDECVGAVVRIRIPVVSPSLDRSEPEYHLPGMVGHSTAWRDYCAELAAASSRSLLLIGAAGSGKAMTARALLQSDRSVATWFDCANWCLGEEVAWLRALRDCPQKQSVIVTHVERLPRSWHASTVAEFSRFAHDGVRLIATATVDDGTSLTSQYNEWFESVVRVPGLRARRDDLALLVNELSRRCVAEGDDPPRWMPDAIQALAGLAWSRNVGGLEAVVRAAVAKAGGAGYVGATSLPPHVLARSTQRCVSRLEHNEITTILETLRECGGNKRMAAEKLGIARSTLHRKLRAMGIGSVST